MTRPRERPADRLRIAVQKSGRLAEPARKLLARCGLDFTRSRDRLFCYGRGQPVDLLLVRDDDIPRLLADGVCDLGIVGENVAMEAGLSLNGEAPQPLASLDFGECRLALAVPEDEDWPAAPAPEGADPRRIATSYPRLVRRWLESRNLEATVVRLSGSVEVAPAMGSADWVADLVSTGSTLRANHLREVAVILESRAAVYGAPSIPPPRDHLTELVLARIEGVRQAGESKYVMLHAPRSALAEIRRLLPGAEAPTVLPLESDGDRVAVHAVCRETLFWEHLEELKSAGASAVLVLPVEKMLA